MSGSFPRRGEVWLADLSPTRGREQRGTRPVLVLSVDTFNAGPSELASVLPITSTIRSIPSHLVVRPPEGGLDAPSAILCDQIRTIARERLVRRRGVIAPRTLARVEEIVRILLGL